MSSTIQTSGDSAALRLPKQVLEESGIKPERLNHKPFKERLAEYGGQIAVEDFNWGEPLGRESLEVAIKL